MASMQVGKNADINNTLHDGWCPLKSDTIEHQSFQSTIINASYIQKDQLGFMHVKLFTSISDEVKKVKKILQNFSFVLKYRWHQLHFINSKLN